MHSSASRAANGMSSAKCACEDPNRSFISEARNEPRASAASSGSVIMYRGLNACCTIIMDYWSQVNSGAELRDGGSDFPRWPDKILRHSPREVRHRGLRHSQAVDRIAH